MVTDANRWHTYAERLGHQHQRQRLEVKDGKLSSGVELLNYFLAALLIYIPIETVETFAGSHLDVLHQLEAVLCQKLARSRLVLAMTKRVERPFQKMIGPIYIWVHTMWNDERTRAVRQQAAPYYHRFMSRSLGRTTSRLATICSLGMASAILFGLPLVISGLVVPLVASVAHSSVIGVARTLAQRSTYVRVRDHGRHVSRFDRKGNPVVISNHELDPWWQIHHRQLRRLGVYRVEEVERYLTSGIAVDDAMRARLRRVVAETLRQGPDGKMYCCAGRKGEKVGTYRLALVLDELIYNDSSFKSVLYERLKYEFPEVALVVKQIGHVDEHHHEHGDHDPHVKHSFLHSYRYVGRHRANEPVGRGIEFGLC